MSLFTGLTDALGITSNQQANAAIRNQQNIFGAVDLPTLSPIELQQLVVSGQLTPEQAQSYNLQQSQMQNVYADPKLKQAQMLALQNLQDVGQNGMSAVDKAKLAQIQSNEDTALRGQREALAQNAQMRGVGGSGIDQLNQQLATQQAANRQSARDTDVQAQSQQARMQALQQAGALASQMGSQDWQQQAERAQAADAINQFNIQNRQNVAMANTQMRNQAQQQNLANSQNIANANAQIANQQRQYNASIPQQNFQNAMGRAGNLANAYGNQAQQYNQQSAQGMNTMAGLAQAGAMMYMASDISNKENIQKGDLDIDDFLNSITGYKYNYKDQNMGQGDRLGVMAQDMEKSSTGKDAVVQGPNGKEIDMKAALSASLASLARLNERLNALEGK